MKQELLARRDAARARQDRARDRWPDRSGAQYLSELMAAKRELETVADEVGTGQPDDPEIARTWRYIGDVCLDVCDAGHPAELEQARRAYLHAEELSAARPDDAEAGRLAYNMATVLFRLADASDEALLQQSVTRARRAKAIFERFEPALVSRAETITSAAEDSLHRRAMMAHLDDTLATGQRALSDSRAEPDRAKKMAILATGTATLPGAGEVRGLFRGQVVRVLEQIEKVRPELSVERDGENDAFKTILLESLRDLDYGFGAAADRDGERFHLVVEGLRGRLDRRIQQLMRALTVEVSRSCQPRDVRRSEELLRKCIEHGLQRPEAGPIPRRLCELASEVQRHARRYNLAVAFPFWPSAADAVDCQKIYFAGRGAVFEELAAVTSRMGLSLTRAPREGDVAAEAWNALRSSAAAVFDVPDEAASSAAVYYEYGLALALGVPAILLAGEQALPFDMEDEPVRLTGTRSERRTKQLQDAIELALFRSPVSGTEGELEETERELGCLLAQVPRAAAAVARLEMARHLPKDPTLFTGLVQQALEKLPGLRPTVLFPRYPPRYADASQPGCFHVFPFRQPWSTSTSAEVAAACRDAGCDYVRADDTPELRAVKSIWDEIGKASKVLVDVTVANPNVALELAVAQAFGKDIKLVMRESPDEMHLLPHIPRLQVRRYRDGTLRSLVHGWLAQGGAAAQRPGATT